MHIKEGQNREELVMLSYDIMVPRDNPVRLIDLLCKKFIADNPWREEWKGTKGKGRKSYPPAQMLSLLVYGYFNKVTSSRMLEKEAYRNIEVIWLLEGLAPDHWTICTFRRENEGLIKDLLKSFRSFLLGEGYASGKRMVFDGSKMKAYARREMLTKDGIDKKLENLDKSIAEYLSQLEGNDSRDAELDTAREEIEKLKGKISKLEKLKSKYEIAGKALAQGDKKRIAPNDPDAVLVKGRDGKFAGYNTQSGVEGKGHFIMHNEVTTAPADQQQLENCVEKAIEETSIVPQEVLADKGYGNTAQILRLEEKGIGCYIPLAESAREKEEKKGMVFLYDQPSDTYTCPQGKKLHLHIKNKKHHGSVYAVYKCKECEGCMVQENCTKSKTGRTYSRNIEQEKIDKYKEKLTSDYAKERIAERKGVVEHPFGTIKWMMGKFNFLLTGKEKAQIELDLYTTAYNIKRLMNCGETMGLMGQISKYNWAVA